MGCDGELWARADNQSGCPGDTDFSVQHPRPALPHQSLFSPDRADQWPRVMVVSSFVWRYSMSHHSDGSTRPERDRKRKACHGGTVQNVLLGGHVAVWGRGWGSLEDFFVISLQQVKEGMWCLGLGNGVLETDSSEPH